MSIIQQISLYLTALLVLIQILVLSFTNIDLKKRRILLIFDFLGIFLLYCGIILWSMIVMPWLTIPLTLLFFILYNLILFKIVRRFILRARAVRIKDEINEAIIEALKSLSELDHKSAYEILEEALKKHPDSRELLNLKVLFDKRLKPTQPHPHIKQIQ